MNFLRFLEGIRTPFLDTLFSLITHLGEETVFILVGIVFFWCIDKEKGYFILSVGFVSTVLNSFLKLLFRIPRPWVKDPSFTIVESARAEATGYSFPSGHTQTAVGVFGSIARLAKGRTVRILCIAACVAVPLSRMYLGVHTPLDVSVAAVVSLALVLGLYPLMRRIAKSTKGMLIFFGATSLISLAFLLYVILYRFPSDIDPANYASGLKNAYKLLGCTLGIFIAYLLDVRYIHFDTRAPLLGQVLKVVLGLLPLLLVKEGFRYPLALLFGDSPIADGVRYLLLTLVAGGVWPLTFARFSRITLKKREKSAKS